jgi:serine/threonine-protein phosphatase 6 regulatory ankyrin repeat subunit B
MSLDNECAALHACESVEDALRLLGGGADADARTPGGHTAFHLACWYGREDLASFWLSHGCHPDGRSSDGGTALHLAANAGREGVVRLLLRAGADARAADNEGLTPLHEACSGGFAAVAHLLLASGADIHAVTAAGATPLHLACMHGGDVWYAIGSDADVSAVDADRRTPLHYAAKYGHECTVRQLMRAGADPRARDRFGHAPAFWAWEAGCAAAGRAAAEGMDVEPEWLRAACGEDHADCVRALLDMGAAPCSLSLAKSAPVALALLDAGAGANDADAYGDTPLYVACCKGRDAVALALIERGADARATSRAGRTAMHVCRSTDVVGALVLVGANVNARDERGVTPLQLACATGSEDLVMAMLRAGADASSCGPLHLSRSAAITAALLDAGANADARDAHGSTALHRACVENKADVAHQLVLRRALLSPSDDRGRTPMHCAALGASIECARYLISCGADPGRADHSGTTPLHIACSLRQVDMATALMRAGASPSVADDDETDPMDPLRIACHRDFPDDTLLEMLGLVDDAYIEKHSAELLCAMCSHGRFDAALGAARRGADPFQLHPRTGTSAVQEACTKHGGSKFLAEFLTPENAPGIAWGGNMTLLRLACMHRITDVAALLVRLGADTRALQIADEEQWAREMLGQTREDLRPE